jgi:hypothetical protein
MPEKFCICLIIINHSLNFVNSELKFFQAAAWRDSSAFLLKADGQVCADEALAILSEHNRVHFSSGAGARHLFPSGVDLKGRLGA